MDADRWLADTRTSYDTVAVSYADQLREALTGAPYLRAALALFADLVHAAGGGPVADVGCGPGHVTAHLHKLGVDAFGIDLSSGMIDVARRDHPRLRFEVGSMTDLDLADASAVGLLASRSAPRPANPRIRPASGARQSDRPSQRTAPAYPRWSPAIGQAPARRHRTLPKRQTYARGRCVAPSRDA
ncbi:class I SAM-dependent methyltransferase [Streptomyces sp. NBC_01530]|uniref:class I SAM-dependent methyltransferase n=1 Tax=Streptomyces sp. NBC_01530 TaxID=2903895 RepID=UPI0038634873